MWFWNKTLSSHLVLSPSLSPACLQCFEEKGRWLCRCPFRTDVVPCSRPPVPAAAQHLNTDLALQLYMYLAKGLTVWHHSVDQNERNSRNWISVRMVLCVWVCVFASVWAHMLFIHALLWSGVCDECFVFVLSFFFFIRCRCDTRTVSLMCMWNLNSGEWVTLWKLRICPYFPLLGA